MSSIPEFGPEPDLAQHMRNVFAIAENARKKKKEKDLSLVLKPLFIAQTVLGAPTLRFTESGPCGPSKIGKTYSAFLHAIFFTAFIFYIVRFFNPSTSFGEKINVILFTFLQVCTICRLITTYIFDSVKIYRRLLRLHLELNVPRISNLFRLWVWILVLAISFKMVYVSHFSFTVDVFDWFGLTVFIMRFMWYSFYISVQTNALYLALNAGVLRNFRMSLKAKSQDENQHVSHGPAQIWATSSHHYNLIMMTYRKFINAFQLQAWPGDPEGNAASVKGAIEMVPIDSYFYLWIINYITAVFMLFIRLTLDMAISNNYSKFRSFSSLSANTWVTVIWLCVIAELMQNENKDLELFLLEQIRPSKNAEQRRRLKSFLRLVRATPRDLTLFRMFRLDKGFIIDMLVAILTYTVVVLQFKSLYVLRT